MGNLTAPDFTILGTVDEAPIQIQTFTWNGGSSGLWNYTATNWRDGAETSSAFLPDNNATFTSGATVVITNTGVSAGFLSNNVPLGQTTRLTGGSLTSSMLVNAGAGSLVLECPGTYTTVNLTAGGITASANGSLSGAVNVSGGSVLNVGTFSNTIGTLVVDESSVSGTGILTTTGSSFALEQNDQLVAVSMAGSGGLAKTGSKTLTLSGSNSFIGNIGLSGGMLATSGDERLPDTAVVAFSALTTLKLGGNETINSLSAASVAASSTVDLQSYNLTLTATSSNQFQGTLIGSGSLTKQGAAILSIDGNNTFTGGTVLKSGSMRLQGSGTTVTDYFGQVSQSSSPFGTGLLTIQGGKIYSSGVLSRTIYNAVRVEGDFTIGDAGSGDMNVGTLSGGLSNNFTTLATSSIVTVSSATDWYQRIEGAGKGLTMSSSSSTQLLRLRGANTMDTLTVLQGRLAVQNSNNLSSVLVGSNGTLGWGWSNMPGTCSYLGAATVILSNGATIGQYGFCGADNALEKRTLTNNLRVSGDIILGLGTYASTFSGGVDLNGGTRGLLLSNSATFSGSVSNGTLVLRTRSANTNGTFNSARSLSLNANNSQNGTTLDGSTLILGGDRALGLGSLVVNSNPVFDATVFVLDTNTGLTNTVIYSGVKALNTVAVDADRIVSNDITLSTGSTLRTLTATTTDLVTTNPTDSTTVTNITTNAYTWTQNGSVSGAGGILKTGVGTLRLAGGASYTGLTEVTEGNLQVVKTNLMASFTTSTVTIAFSNGVSAGTYPILPGGLSGSYGSPSVSGLDAGQSASFNASAGSVTVTGNPVSSGPSFADSYPGQSLTDLAPNGLSYLMNYALGGSSANGISTPVSSTDSSTLSIIAIVRINDSKCQIVGEATTSLTAWPTNSPISGVPLVGDQAGTVPGVTQKQVFSVNRGPDLKKFLRLKAIYTP